MTEAVYVTQERADWVEKENPRVTHEWNQWDGTPEQAEAINGRQCERMKKAFDAMPNRGIDLG